MFDLADDYNLLKFFNEKIYIGLQKIRLLF